MNLTPLLIVAYALAISLSIFIIALPIVAIWKQVSGMKTARKALDKILEPENWELNEKEQDNENSK